MKISNIIFTAMIIFGLILIGLNNVGISPDSGQTIRAAIGSVLTLTGALVLVLKHLFVDTPHS